MLRANPGAPAIQIGYLNSPPAGYFTITSLAIYGGNGSGITIYNAGNLILNNLRLMGNYTGSANSASDGNGIEILNTVMTTFSEITIQDVTIQGFGILPQSSYLTDYGGAGHGILISSYYPLPVQRLVPAPKSRPGQVIPIPLGGGFQNITIGKSSAGTGCEILYASRAAIEITGLADGLYNRNEPNPPSAPPLPTAPTAPWLPEGEV